MPIISGGGGGGGSSAGKELSYTQITTSANVTDTSEATATALISPGAITFDGAAVLVTFFCPNIVTPTPTSTNDFVVVTLFEGATQIGRLGIADLSIGATADELSVGCTFHFRFTPSVGAHTYKVCAFTNSVTGTPMLTAGAGGTGVYVPTFVRFTKV